MKTNKSQRFIRLFGFAQPELPMSSICTLIAMAAISAPAWAALPVPCGGGPCGVNPAALPFVGNGNASYLVNGNSGLVSQTTSKAILNWQSFNIGAGQDVKYQYLDAAGNAPKGANFSTLNCIWQGSPSEIAGKLSVQAGQNGAIYLINQNGILFKSGAQVDVNTLVASALNIKDADFLHPDGLLHPYLDSSRPAFVWEGDASGFQTSLVRVEPGAMLKASLGGAIMLIAPTVINQGKIETDGGQVILAAGGKVYLTAPPDYASWAPDSPYRGLAGLLVEVDPHVDTNGTPHSGEVTNGIKDTIQGGVGEIIAQRGNVTLVGLTVNQYGRINATSAVTEKGSIRLLARQGHTTETTVEDVTGVLSASETGTLTFGKGSETSVLPDQSTAGQTITGDQAFNASTVQGVGAKIIVDDRAKIQVPGGYVTLSAQADGADFMGFKSTEIQANNSRVYLGKDSVIDVAGTTVDVSVERYFQQVDLRGTELKDDPLNRSGFINGKKVWVDLRNLPDSSFADLSGYAGAIPSTVQEKLSTGGSVKLRSEGDIVQAAGSTIDVSGGKLNVAGGIGTTSRLVSGGQVIDIAQAKGDRVYDNIFDQYTVTDKKWGASQVYNLPANRHYYQGYVEGKDAGKVSFLSFGLSLDGQIKGGVTVGPNQRQSAPHAGQLVIGNEGAGNADYKTAAVTILNSFDPLAGLDPTAPLPQSRIDTALLSADMLNRSGLGKVAVYSNGEIKVEAGSNLALPAFGELALTGSKITVDDDVRIASGSIAFTAQLTFGSSGGVAIDVAPGATLSTAGMWVNDKLNGPDLSKLIANGSKNVWDGGTVSLQSAGALTLGADSVVDVSGSGYVNAKGKFTGGNAGGITLVTNKGQVQGGQIYAPLTLAGNLRAFAPGKGGSLRIAVPAITLGNAVRGESGEQLFTPEFFAANGFANYTLEGRDSVVVSSETTIAPTVGSLHVNPDYAYQASGSDIGDFSSVWVKPEYDRQGVNITLKATNDKTTFLDGKNVGWLTVEKGATLQTGPGGKITLAATSYALDVEGKLIAPGGIELNMQQVNANGTVIHPGEDPDLGYDKNQVIWIGKDARLSAAGTVVNAPSANGLRNGKVLDAGNIVINADRGYVVAAQGAVLDVSGTAATFDLPAQGSGTNTITAQTIAGNAGSIQINAREGALIDATLHGQSSGARGGTLALTLDRNNYTGSPFAYPGVTIDPTRQWKIELSQSQNSVPDSLKVGDKIDIAAPGRMEFAVDRALQGGFEQLAFNAEHGITFKGDVAVQTAPSLRAIVLNTPVIESDGGKVRLDAAYVNLGNQSPISQRQVPQTAIAGNGTLDVSARQVDLTGNFALQGFNQASIQSDGDVRLVGVVKDNLKNVTDNAAKRPEGSLTLANDLTIKARQVYATTLSSYTISSPANTIQIARSGNPTPVLSAASDLKFQAATIRLEGTKPGEQGGVVKAPFGSVTLSADQIVLGDGSKISVSGENQTVPYGSTELTGRDYTYNLGDAKRDIGKTPPPEKQIVLDGKNVAFKSGATLDVSGGGDLQAYEWIAGQGGSKDTLGASVSPNTYAVLPGYTNGFAPSDSQFLAELKAANVNTPAPGSVVYLAGVTGLKSDYYTLLPARYGLLPDAQLVTLADAKYMDILPNQSVPRPLGGSIVSGYFAALNRDGSYTQTSRSQGFIVEPNSVVKAKSEYRLTTATGYFGDKGYPLPGDAGHVVFNANQSLNLLGKLVAQREAGYRGAEVDIAAPRLAVVSEGGAAFDTSGMLLLDADKLNAMGAESLLLGGTRSAQADGVDVNVVADNVVVANVAQHALAAPEIILAANQEVRLKKDSAVYGQGTNVTRGTTLNITNSAGDGALVRASGGQQMTVLRNAVAGATGDLIQETGAVVQATGSLNLDATRDTQLSGTLDLGTGAALALSSGAVSVGNVPGAAAGLKFNAAAFQALTAKSDDLRLRSYDTIDFFGPLDLISNGNIRLEAQGLVGHLSNAADSVKLSGKQVVLANPTATDGIAAAGVGNFVISGEEVRTGDGVLAVSGFGDVKLLASKQIVADGVGSLTTTAPLTLDAPRVTSTMTTQQYKNANGNLLPTFKSAGKLTVLASAGKAPALLQSVPGAELAFEGSDVAISGLVDLPGGKISTKATGGDVTLASGGELRVAGNEKWIFDAPVGQPGGEINLTAANNVNLASGSLVDVSATGADAGTLRITATNGSVVTDGDLQGGSAKGSDGATGNQGRFELDVGALANLGSLAGKLGAGNFNDSVRIRVRNGDTQLASGDTLKAREIQIAADEGSLSIGGELNASHPRGGLISLAAKNDLTLLGDGVSGAQLSAKATEAGQAGGRVEMAAADGYLDLQGGSSINVSGGTGASGGQVWLRTGVDGTKAPKVKKDAGGNFNLKTAVTGADYTDAGGTVYTATYLEAVKQYTPTKDANNAVNIDSALISSIKADVTTFYNGLVKPVSIFRVVPGVEIVNTGGDINLTSAWNFDSVNTFTGVPLKKIQQELRFGSNKEAGVLTFHAKGDINFMNSLSDGFMNITNPRAGYLPWTFDTSQANSWSYRIAAGSDFSRAAPLALTQGSGTVKINEGQTVRTGSGFIDVAAGQDISFGSITGSATSAGVLYTAGRNGPALSSFILPNRNQIANYTTGGGDIRLYAGRNVSGQYVATDSVNQWLYRSYTAGTDPNTTWWPRFDLFHQGVATLGGGSISVEAQGNITSLWLSAPTNGRLQGGSSSPVVQGGGDITERAGGNISDGLVFIAKGQGQVFAGGKLESRTALMDGDVRMAALRDVTVNGAFNPTLEVQTVNNSIQGTESGTSVNFNSYSDAAALNASSLAGNVILDVPGAPARLSAQAPQGSIEVGNVRLFPNATGNVDLLAGKNIKITSTGALTMSDYTIAKIPSIVAPSGSAIPELFATFTDAAKDIAGHDPGLLHLNDPVISRVYAQEGDIASSNHTTRVLTFAKPAIVQAGRDINNLGVTFQNLRDTDTSSVVAGRDIYNPTVRDPQTGAIIANSNAIEVSGPGQLEVIAGRNIDLGTSNGIVSVGNQYNGYLSGNGASVAVLAGMGAGADGVARQPDYAAFKGAYLDPATPAMQSFVAYQKSQARSEVRAGLKYDAEKNGSPLSNAELDQEVDTTYARQVTQRANDLMAAFNAQPQQVQVQRLFFSELRESGVEWAKTGSAERGVKATSLLFPATVGGQAANYAGDINLFFSQIKTEHGGDIELLAPGGLINAGLASAAEGKTASELGIVAVGSGDVRAYVSNDIQVNQSRIFTMGGGDLVLWADQGNIDAGKGAKTAHAAPAPRQVVKAGKVAFDLSGSISGSGIGVLDTIKGAASGNAYLIAPNGAVSAGDAGIRAAGNLTIAAQRVIGADNIQVGGTATGVPVVSSGLGSGLAGVSGLNDASNATNSQTNALSSAAGNKDKAAQEMRDKLAGFRPSFISVEVAGFGPAGQLIE
ncbi:hypothetical protein SCT_0105 [Sulfuricella sp. T08]|uniref:filamentous haemagglutinin family protein n=1 Tax=Sulfuricella sp. T08 TaxID=1632857 RepID=UPI0006179659|nr:filamentous haemagglutinin family protein [Sulfuricella sp. T08]GAO34725.1 hypothetical protein SCT_0105 [Sulfuricella sp. T08]